jgi:phenylacetic acid degradation operon negative regulatory protein
MSEPSTVARGLVAGFDAGQTHTLCRLVDAVSGATLAEAEGPGVSHLAAVGGPERFAEALEVSFARARRRLVGPGPGSPHPAVAAGPRTRSTLVAAAIGASGIETGSPVQEEGCQLAAQALGLDSGRVVVCGDERTALRGAFPDRPGIVVISGTGTICVGRSLHGRDHRCGGWGWLLDGAGSAMDIGRDALAMSLRMADGRERDSPLRREIWRALALDPSDPRAPARLKARVVRPDFGPAGFARLAPVVDRVAAAGDDRAEAILRRSADALVEMVATVALRLELDHPPVCAMGGAIEHLANFRRQFEAVLASRVPTGRLVEPCGDACQGAVAMALEMALETKHRGEHSGSEADAVPPGPEPGRR